MSGTRFSTLGGTISGMTANTDAGQVKVRENRLRQVAKRQGLRLEKPRRYDRRALDYGVFRLISTVAGRPSWYRLTLDEVGGVLNGKIMCPDGGTCHHECPGAAQCFRVLACAPLSGVFPDDRWPEEARTLVAANREPTIEDQLFGGAS